MLYFYFFLFEVLFSYIYMLSHSCQYTGLFFFSFFYCLPISHFKHLIFFLFFLFFSLFLCLKGSLPLPSACYSQCMCRFWRSMCRIWAISSIRGIYSTIYIFNHSCVHVFVHEHFCITPPPLTHTHTHTKGTFFLNDEHLSFSLDLSLFL
jgi:hypothetical protein